MDYDALGRYTHALDRAQKVYEEFSKNLKDLNDDLKRVQTPGGSVMHVPTFDAAKLRAQLEEAARSHAALVELCHEANIQADKCGKPKITTGRGPSMLVV